MKTLGRIFLLVALVLSCTVLTFAQKEFWKELAISNMLEIEALRELLFEKGIITEEEFIARYKKHQKGER